MSNFTSLPVVVATLHADLKRERALKAELLEALELAAHCLAWHHERNGRDSRADGNALALARTAIAKATGGES